MMTAFRSANRGGILAILGYLLLIMPTRTFQLTIGATGSTPERTDQFDSQEYFSRVGKWCTKPGNAMMTCEPEYSGIKSRYDAALAYTQCMIYELYQSFKCAERVSNFDWYEDENYFYVPKNTPSIPDFFNSTKGDGTCGFKAPIPIIYNACKREFDILSDSNCCKTIEARCDIIEPMMNCAYMATLEYVRCSLRLSKSSDPPENVTTCVSRNAPKVEWLPNPNLYLIRGGDYACPSSRRIITMFALSNAIAFMTAVIGNSILQQRILAKFGIQLEGYIQPPKGRIILRYFKFLFTLCVHVAVPIIIALILRAQGLVVDIPRQFVFWMLRPRISFAIAMLGVVHPSWVEKGIAELTVDAFFAIPGFIFALWGVAPWLRNRSDNPAQPYSTLQAFHTGSVVLIIPIILVIVVIAFSLFYKCGPIGLILMSFKDAIRIIRNLIRKMRGIQRRIPPYNFKDTKFRLYYFGFMCTSFLICIGSWMVWTSYLSMAGELYCPARLSAISAILFLYPILLNIVRGVIVC